MIYIAPLLFTLFVWWFSTGVILYLDGLPRRTFKWTMLGATLLAVLGFVGLRASSAVETPAAAYCAFTCALLIWAWQEVAFLLGIVTGPRRVACPADTSGWPRARLAFQTVAHHELALLVLGAGVVAATWGQPNHTGLWTFAVLWAMRQSAKLNVFLGVRNLSEEFLPKHLKYLQSYFRRARMNSLFPIAVALATWLAVLAWQAALADGINAFEATTLTFSATLLSLAILEHWFMVLPLPFAAMWNWGMRSRVPPG
jgi:putative photosynthetic complex assembly protein 2